MTLDQESAAAVVRRVHWAAGYYPARFPYSVATRFMASLDPGSRVVDPFAGSGVACTAARLYGHGCTGLDINPFAVLVARVTSSRAEPGLLERVERLLSEDGGAPWRPRWKRALYWHPENVLRALGLLWAPIHRRCPEILEAGLDCLVAALSLARVSRLYSNADPEIPKLYKGWGPRKLERLTAGKTVEELLGSIRKTALARAKRIIKALREYSRHASGPQPRILLADPVRHPLPSEARGADAVFTSPPYLAAHEYTRSTKLELYWLGYSDEEIRRLRAREIPYGPVPDHPVESPTYKRLLLEIPHRYLETYQRYFAAVARVLDRLVEAGPPRIIALFTGPATLGGRPIPIHDILAEHLEARGYRERVRSRDPIRARRLFRGRNNRNPQGIPHETLVVLELRA